MGSGISNQSPESIKTLLRNIASNKDLGQDHFPIGTIASNKDLELAIAKAALGGPTVLNPYLSFFEIDWRPFEIDCRPFRKRDLHTYRKDLQRYIDSRPFIKLAEGDGSNRPSFDQIGQLTTVANFSNTFTRFVFQE